MRLYLLAFLIIFLVGCTLESEIECWDGTLAGSIVECPAEPVFIERETAPQDPFAGWQLCKLQFLGDTVDPQSICDDAFIDLSVNDYVSGVGTAFQDGLLVCGVPCDFNVKEQCWSTTGMFISYVASSPLTYKVLTPAVDRSYC